MPLPSDHPFSVFNEYFYMESGTKQIPIYLFKTGLHDGYLVELFLNDYVSGPRARIYTLIFADEYNFELDRNIRNITRRVTDDLYLAVIDYLKQEIQEHA